MPPLDRRRRRLFTPGVGIAGAVVLVLLLVIGGAYEVGPASGPYRRDVNRSYAAQGSLLVLASNQEGAELAGLMRDMPGLQRDTLVNRLASLASASAQLAASARGLAPPDPTVAGLPTALGQRATALGRLRRAVDGVLALGGTAPLGATAAASRIASAGVLLTRADRGYALVRRAFRRAPGNALLPRSVWVGDASAWAPGPVATLVAAVASSPSLAPRIRVVLEPSTVSFQPAAVPRVNPQGPSVVPPTRTLSVAVDVANRGNVALHSMLVSARAVPQAPGSPATATSTRVSLAPYSTVAVSLPRFAVTPRDTYTVTVAVVPPPGQTSLATTSLTFDIKVAPPTPPTTTTTTTTRPPTTTTAAPTTSTTSTTPPTTAGGTTPVTRTGA